MYLFLVYIYICTFIRTSNIHAYDTSFKNAAQKHSLKQIHFSVGSAVAPGKSVYKPVEKKNSEKFAVVSPPERFTTPISRECREKSRDDPRTTGERCPAASSSTFEKRLKISGNVNEVITRRRRREAFGRLEFT